MSRRFILLVAASVLLLSIVPHSFTSAQSVTDPSFYELTQSELPAGAQIVQSQVAANGAIISQNLQTGSPLPPGRLTGYYLQARTTSASGGLATVLTYLVSIFDNEADATAAFGAQQTFWQNELTDFGASAFEDNLGDFAAAHLYTLVDANSNADSELFFVRGPLFIEVSLEDFSGLSRDDRDALLVFVARTLESRTLGTPPPITPTPTDTPTSTPTLTPTPKPTATRKPTATPKPTKTPKPTATAKPKPTRTKAPNYGKPVPETPHCKKGFKLVKGKCKKR